MAQHQGTVQFVLRNGQDTENPDIPAVDMAELTGIQKAPPPQPKTARSTRVAAVVKAPDAALKAPDPYVVETVANGKVTIAKFPVSPD